MHCQTPTLMSACQEKRQMHHFNHVNDGLFSIFFKKKKFFLKSFITRKKIQKKLDHVQYTFDDFLYKE